MYFVIPTATTFFINICRYTYMYIYILYTYVYKYIYILRGRGDKAKNPVDKLKLNTYKHQDNTKEGRKGETEVETEGKTENKQI